MKSSSNKTITNRTMPACTIIPVLVYTDVNKAIAWLCENFGFKERWRAGNHRAQLMFDQGAIVVKDCSDTHSKSSIIVRVSSVDSHYLIAKQHGVQMLQPLTDYPYGERQYTAVDIGGHEWTFTQSIADVPPEDWGGTSASAE